MEVTFFLTNTSYLRLNKAHKDDLNRETSVFEGPNHDRNMITEAELYVSSAFCLRQAEGLNQAITSCRLSWVSETSNHCL